MKAFILTVVFTLLFIAAAVICCFVFIGNTAGIIALLSLLGVLAAVVLILVVRALGYGIKHAEKTELTAAYIDKDFAVKSLSDAIKIPTITPIKYDGASISPLKTLTALIRERFTFIKAAEIVDLGLSAIYILRGRGNGAMGINGHLDVVPAGAESLWKRSVFSGEIADGYVYGRGALDMKGQLFAALNAVEYIYKNNIPFEKDIYILTTHDEETVNTGARAVADYLSEKNIKLDYIMDEGGVFFDGASFGIDGDIAFIGINEKGYMDVKLTATEVAGHSAIPPKETAIESISKAITGIQYKRNKPHINTALAAMIRELLPHMSFVYRLIFANLWLFKPVVLYIFGETPETNALIRTTVAPTVVHAGNAYNVLPEAAEAVFNCRINSPDTVEGTMQYIKRRVDRVEVELIQGNNPTKFSITDCAEYRHLKKIINSVYGNQLVTAPFQVVASTDCHEYYGITDKAYRFVPFLSFKADMGTVHSENERIRIDSYMQGIEFFVALLTQPVS